MDKKQCYEKIFEQLNKIDELKREEPFSPKFQLWKTVTEKILHECFDKEIADTFDVHVTQFAMTDAHQHRLYLENLEDRKCALEGILELLKDENTISKVEITKSFAWEYEMHSEIKSVSQRLMENKHYAQAVEEAFKRVISEVKIIVKNKVGKELDGDPLMNFAFGCENQEPVIKFNSLQTREEKDEQKGIMYLFKGIVGIRNRKAHENVNLDDPYRAFEYLALASLLIRLLDVYAK